ncbi:uncharacterized protein LOC111301820 [Durio zibethinus]|uniref:Uncharacterized protein LOC111301820 n=1 Tax=Durio zibethinus TaxID=66656 RepID=A0A6P5ZKZ9_DURZI|nr:uncharacterized protein LOC111301820 [Durio zibethinus]
MAREHKTSAQLWGTLEELLLACAVNRHGTNSWDSIALELQNRRICSSSSSLLPSFTPQLCQDKFMDLKRRFISPNDAAFSSSLVDQLRRIRVEELRREVQQRDVSIVSLELKVKRLVEERERSLKDETDLDDRQNNLPPQIIAGKHTAGEDSGDIGDRSFNESNSTSQKPEDATTTTTTTTTIVKDEQNDEGEVVGQKKAQVKTEPVEPGAANESDLVRTGKGPGNERVNGEEPNNKKQMSDVQSSSSLSKKKRRSGSSRGESSSGEEREENEFSPAKMRVSAVKPESLIRLLRIIRSHRLGSAFDRRQRSQESERYKNLIKQHMDLQRIQSRLDKGVYSGCTTKFFRDLLLLFNNITVFHRQTSPEYIAAQELRALVLKEMSDKLRKHSLQLMTLKPETDQPPVSLSKPNKSSTIVACSKRSSIKALAQNATRRGDKKEREIEEKPKETEKVDTSSFVGIDDKGIGKKRSKERAVSGRRNSLRASSKNGETKHEYGGNELSSHDALELKVDKKENMARKKQGAASFLQRMKQNSPSKVTEKDDNNDYDDDDVDDSDDESKDSKEKARGRRREVKRVTRSSGGRGAREESGRVKRGVGRPSKRAAAESTTGKRGRDNVENEVGVGGTGRARKRSRR